MPAIHILYMEDDEGTARLLQRRLSRLDYVIDTVSTGEEGLAQSLRSSYDMVLIDYHMPGMNGLQVMRELLTRHNPPVVIMLTGSGNEKIAVEALKLGATDYVVKDVEGVYLELMPAVLEQSLKHRRLLEDKRHAEAALVESEERFRTLFEMAPDAFAITDLEGRLLECNPATATMMGTTRENLIGKTTVESGIFTSEDMQKLFNSYPAGTAGSAFYESEMPVQRFDGQPITLEIRAIPVTIKGEPRVLAIARDISWRKQIETELRVHNEQLQTLSFVDDELTRKLDLDYVLTMANDLMIGVSGASAGGIGTVENGIVNQIHLAGYPDRLSLNFNTANPSIVRRVIRQRKAELVNDVSVDPDYSAFMPDTCSQITIPLISQDRLIGIVCLESNQPDQFNQETFEFMKLIASRVAVAIDNADLFDITRRQVAELQDLYVQVSKLEQLKTDMIRIATHDLRNPLAVIMSYADLLRKSTAQQMTPKQQNYLEQISGAAKRMKAITADFLSLDRIEEIAANKLSHNEEINLADLVQSMCISYSGQAEQKKQVFRYTFSEAHILVQGFKTDLQQAVANLIGNAIKYTPEGGSINISLQREAALARFEVVDTGYGIPAEAQRHLFQPFFRVKTEDTEPIEGTGLGLYIVKKVVENHGGQMIFRSEAGSGSTFGFDLPVPVR